MFTPRAVVAALLVLGGIAWIVVYLTVSPGLGASSWMAGLGRWNYLVGFGAILLGLLLAANPATPLGRGRGVVVGMLTCFLVGLAWIVVYYMAGSAPLPVFSELAQYNLVVGVGFVAVGFAYATRWE